MKNILIQTYTDMFNVNKRALKSRLKEAGIKPSKASALEIVDTIYICAPELMFSRESDADTVEFLDGEVGLRIVEEQKRLRGDA